jgi:hypothetical protein
MSSYQEALTLLASLIFPKACFQAAGAKKKKVNVTSTFIPYIYPLTFASAA